MDAQRDNECESLILQAFFNREGDVLRWVRHGWNTLPPSVRPTHFGTSDRIRRKPTNVLSDVRQFQSFIGQCQGTCFMYGQDFTVGVSPDDKIPSEITFWASSGDPRLSRFGPEILENFDQNNATYGFGCTWEEYRARNGYVLHYVDGGRSEGWCGRDFRQYIPGLFWLNYFSRSYAEAMQLDLQAIVERLHACLVATAKGHILQLYDHPCQWCDQADEVNNVIYQTPNMFSKRRVDFPVNASKWDLDAASSISDNWP